MNDPILFAQGMETPEADEAKTTADMVKTLLDISAITYKDGHHALRSVHAKSHAILKGTLTVPSNLPTVLSQGLFAQPGTYPVILRLSSTPGDLLDDSVSTPRGLAIKVIGVAGERLPGSEGAVTQDFILINGPAFAAPDASARPQVRLGNRLARRRENCRGIRRRERHAEKPGWAPSCGFEKRLTKRQRNSAPATMGTPSSSR
jgi:hypothetical protein